jgi:hypothetical protein
MSELREDTTRRTERLYRQGQQTDRSVHRIALQPVARPRNAGQPTLGVAGGVVGVVNNTATLSRNPRTLFILWQEYEFGIAGRKAAKNFTALERGRVKYNYHRRKVVWEKIAEMIRAGHTANTAIDAILVAYGEGTPVTRIINLMRVQRTRGGHPALQV